MLRSLVHHALTLVALLCTTPGVAQDRAAQDPGTISGGLGKKLDAAVLELDPPFWGSVLVTVEGSVVLAKGYGLADRERWPNTKRTYFDIGSVSKSFTAAAILKLEMQEKLELDDSISKHLPNVPPDKHGVTIRHLLQHTSGIPHDRFPQSGAAGRDEMLAFVLAGELASVPGERFQYSNVGYFLLAAIIELTGKRTFERYLTENLFLPASMKDTGFVDGTGLDRSRASRRSYRRGGEVLDGSVFEYPWNWYQKGATGVVTTADELFRWTRALEIERVLDEEAKAEMFTAGPNGYGLGWFVDELGGKRRWWHGGATGGYRAQLAVHADDRVTVVVMSDKSDVTALEARLSTIALTYARGLSEELLARLAGRYALDGANRFEVVVEDTVLVLVPEGTLATSLVFYASPTLPGWPNLLDELERVARDHMRRVAGDDAEAARAVFEGHDAARAGLDAWAVLRSELGRYSHVTVLGSNSGAEMVSYVRAHFERGDAELRLRWTAKRRLAALERWTEPVPYRLTLTPLSNEELVAKSLAQTGELTLNFGALDPEEETPAEGFELRVVLASTDVPTDALTEEGTAASEPEPVVLRAARLPDAR